MSEHTLKCPHCNTPIEMMSTTDIVEETRASGWDKFHGNYFTKLIAADKFPAPYFTSAGRNFWLRQQYEGWQEERNSKKQREAVETIAGSMKGLSAAQRKAILAEIRKQLEAE